MYTKFDCFHCVLPLDHKSQCYFNEFDHFKECKEKYELPYGRVAIQKLFPLALLQHAMDNIGELVKINTGLGTPANVIINGFDSGTKTLKIPSAPTQVVEAKDFSIGSSDENSLVTTAFKKNSIARNNPLLLCKEL